MTGTICRFAATEMITGIIILLLTGETIIMILSKVMITEGTIVVMYLTGQMISREIITGMVILKDAGILLTGTIIAMISRLIMTGGEEDLLTDPFNNHKTIRLNPISGMNKDQMDLTGTGMVIPLLSQRGVR